MRQDACVYTPLQRASPQQPPVLTPQVLLRAGATLSSASTSTTPPALVTFTCQQQFLQEIHDTKETYNLRDNVSGPLQPTEDNGHGDGHHLNRVDSSVDLDRLLGELLELREALGKHLHCISSAERRYLTLLRQHIVCDLTQAILTATSEPHGSGNIKETCRPLLTLCVKPTSLSREIAFSLMHSVVERTTILSACTLTHQTKEPHTTHLQHELFRCVNDMVVKSVAVASSSVPTVGNASPSDDAWTLNATASLLTLLRSSDGNYRADRLARLDPSTAVFLVRRAFSLTTATANEAELQDAVVEMLVSAMYAHNSRTTASSISGCGITLSEVERFGGVDLLLAIFYRTTSDHTRRLLLVVVFDLVMDQLKHSKARDEDKDTWIAYETILRCLQQCEFATLVGTTPLSFITNATTTARFVKTLHTVVDNELLEKHIALVWSALRSVLQVDEYFAHSASLVHTMKLLANQVPQQQAHDSAANLIVAKVQQLILSPRLEDRFKGERWLAELLVHGLRSDAGISYSDNKAAHESFAEQNFTIDGIHKPCEEQLDKSPCNDEAADIRLAARAKLWELCRSPSVTSRMAFAHVLGVFTRHRIRSWTPAVVLTSHLRELKQFLDALADQHEDSTTIVMTILDILLHVVAVPSLDVPYLDVHRQRYDTESSDEPQQLVGALVGSESLAAKILRGTVSVDRSRVAEISLPFLLHVLDVLDAAASPVSSSGRQTPCLMADYATVTALVVSYTLEDSPPQRDALTTLSPFLDACDTRIAVIAARSIVVQLKRNYGDQRYIEIVRQIHSAAVENDDEAPLANSVAHARAVLRVMAIDGLTP